MNNDTVESHGVSFRDAVRVWVRVAALSFGGPAGQIAVMHRILVEEKRWLSETRFLHALNYCMLLPGPEAHQLAIYIGWLLHRTRGGLVAGTLFVLPGLVSLWALSWLYAEFGGVGTVQALFFGLKAAVLAIVLEAVVRVGRRALKSAGLIAVAALGFVGIFFLAIPFPIIIIGAALIGLAGRAATRSEWFRHSGYAGHRVAGAAAERASAAGAGGAEINGAAPGRAGSGGAGSGPAGLSPTAADRAGLGEAKAPAAIDRAFAGEVPEHVRPSLSRFVKVAAIGLVLWLTPLVALLATVGPHNVLTAIAAFNSRMAVVTFGGAYAALAYMAQQAVQNYHWLRPGEMLVGLGFAETTPGPLISVVQFVGFMAAYRAPGELAPAVAGTVGGFIAEWATFVPSFIWIFLGGPYIEALRNNEALSAALSAITAAVVGVILNLAIWFGLHTLFGEVRDQYAFGMVLHTPILQTVNIPALALSLAAMVALFRFKLGMIPVLLACSAAGIAGRLAGVI